MCPKLNPSCHSSGESCEAESPVIAGIASTLHPKFPQRKRYSIVPGGHGTFGHQPGGGPPPTNPKVRMFKRSRSAYIGPVSRYGKPSKALMSTYAVKVKLNDHES